MKKHSILFSILCYLFSLAVHAATFNNLVVFGDSLSDTGNLYEYTQQSYPPSPPYFDGRFSNGKIWVERLAEAFFPKNTTDHVKNYAFGGAGVATDEGSYFSLQTEVETYLLANSNKADPDTLFLVWIGSNNYFGLIEEKNASDLIDKTTTDVISGMQKTLERLSKAGAKKIVILNLPDIGKTPSQVNHPENQSILSEAIASHNAKLLTAIHDLETQFPETQWIPIDTWQAFYNVLSYPEQFGFNNITEACLKVDQTRNFRLANTRPMLRFTIPAKSRQLAACDEYVFFDPVHPTERFHGFIAQLAKEVIDRY